MKKKKLPKNKKIIKPPVLNNDYLLSLADKLHRMNPAREIILNTLTSIAIDFYNEGYSRRIRDNSLFKSQQEKHFQEEWNKLRDEIDNKIHENK